MATLKQTKGSGFRFEDEVVSIISAYASAIWRNIRVETLLTASGTTEIDILFCFKNIVFIVEAKNVSTIMGDYADKTWSFIGSTSAYKETKEYTSLNVITQNNIHGRSFKDLFYVHFKEWPRVFPIIVVPNTCNLSPELQGCVYTLEKLESVLREISSLDIPSKIQRRVASIIPANGTTLLRPDFILDTKLGKRVKSRG